MSQNQGVVEQPLISLTVQATPGGIPNSIEVDISDLAIGDTIRVGDLPLPDGVTTDVDAEEAVVIAQGSAVAAEVAADQEADAVGTGGGARRSGGRAAGRRGACSDPARVRPPTCWPSGSAIRATSTRAPATTSVPTSSACWPGATASACGRPSGSGPRSPRWSSAAKRLALAFPQTYMNDSGLAVAPLVRRFGIEDLASPGRRPRRARPARRPAPGQSGRRSGRPQRPKIDQGPPAQRRLHPDPGRDRQTARAGDRASTTCCRRPAGRSARSSPSPSRWRPTRSSSSSTDGVVAAQNRFNAANGTE